MFGTRAPLARFQRANGASPVRSQPGHTARSSGADFRWRARARLSGARSAAEQAGNLVN